jgi:hypothetical protein
LPDELFLERAAGWQTTVRGLAAAEAIPDETHLAHLRESVDHARAEIERL